MLPKRIFWHTNKGKTNTLNTWINASEHLFFFLNVSLSQFLFKWSPDLFVEKTNCKETRQFGIFQQNRAIYTNINTMDWTNYHILTNLEFSDIRDIKGYSSLTYTFPYGEKLVPQRVHDQLVDLLTFNESNGAEVMTMRGCFTWGMKEGPRKVVYGVEGLRFS